MKMLSREAGWEMKSGSRNRRRRCAAAKRTRTEMLDTLTLVEVRDLPTLPDPRPATKEKMLALAALVDVPVDITAHRTGILPRGCWWMPQAQLVLYGSACQRPILLDEVRTICSATALSGLIVRDYSMSASRTRYTFDAYRHPDARAPSLRRAGAPPILCAQHHCPRGCG